MWCARMLNLKSLLLHKTLGIELCGAVNVRFVAHAGKLLSRLGYKKLEVSSLWSLPNRHRTRGQALHSSRNLLAKWRDVECASCPPVLEWVSLYGHLG